MQPLELKKGQKRGLITSGNPESHTNKREVRRRKDEEKLRRSHKKKAIVALKGWIHLLHTRIAAAFALYVQFLIVFRLKSNKQF